MRKLNTDESIQLLVNEYDYIRRMKLHPGVSQDWVDRILRIMARMIDEIEIPNHVGVKVMTAPCSYVGDPDVEFDATDSDFRTVIANTFKLPVKRIPEDDELATIFADVISKAIADENIEWFCPYVILQDMGTIPSLNANGYSTRYGILRVQRR